MAPTCPRQRPCPPARATRCRPTASAPDRRGEGIGRELFAWQLARARQILASSGKDLPARRGRAREQDGLAGPLLLRALVAQDMYLAGGFILLMGILTLIGMLVSDLLLAALDPRIRFT